MILIMIMVIMMIIIIATLLKCSDMLIIMKLSIPPSLYGFHLEEKVDGNKKRKEKRNKKRKNVRFPSRRIS